MQIVKKRKAAVKRVADAQLNAILQARLADGVYSEADRSYLHDQGYSDEVINASPVMLNFLNK
jgi:hypothetical protein